MAVIDKIYHNLLETILKDGETVYDKSREINTIQIPHYTLDLRSMMSIPLITTKKLFYKSVIAELIFFLKGKTNIKYLIDNNCNIWNKDAYAYYTRRCREDKITTMLGFESFLKYVKTGDNTYMVDLPTDYNLGDLGPVYGNQWHRHDQFEKVIQGIINSDFNRRLLVSGWNVEELPKMALPPCHWAWEAIKQKDGFVIKWHQRSVDTFLGLPFNIASYYFLGVIIGVMTGKPFYGLIGDLSNVHIYENHIDAVKDQLSNNVYKYSGRDIRMVANSDIHWNAKRYRQGEIDLKRYLEELNPENIGIIGYESYPAIKADMLAQIE